MGNRVIYLQLCHPIQTRYQKHQGRRSIPSLGLGFSRGGDTTEKQPVKAILRPEQFVIAAAPTTMITINPDQALRDKIKRQASMDTKYKEIVDTIPTNSSMATKGYRMDNDGLVLYQDRIYLPDDDQLKLQIMEHHHDLPMAGHYGRAITMDLVLRNYFFPA